MRICRRETRAAEPCYTVLRRCAPRIQRNATCSGRRCPAQWPGSTKRR